VRQSLCSRRNGTAPQGRSLSRTTCRECNFFAAKDAALGARRRAEPRVRTPCRRSGRNGLDRRG
jgi:hypothetical protein